MSYTPQPGTVAFRAIAHLETLPRGAELMTSALAEAIGCDGKNIVPSLEAALASGLVFRRQRDNHVRSPMWWSLVDHGARPKVDIRRPAVPVANGHGELHVPTFKDSGTTGLEPVADGSQKPNGGVHGSPARAGSESKRRSGQAADGLVVGGATNCEGASAPVALAPNTQREPGPQQVLKAEPATADATDRGAPVMASPRVGAMGVGQAADAAPADGFRCALWSNGTLQIERSTVAGAAELVLLSREETRALVRYLDSICLDVVRWEGAP